MAYVKTNAKLTTDIKITLTLSEGEARALEAICGYGPEKFVEWFYRNLGKHYLKPHEDAMRSLFKTIRDNLPIELKKIEDINKFIKSL